jgi:hypothetical protein
VCENPAHASAAGRRAELHAGSGLARGHPLIPDAALGVGCSPHSRRLTAACWLAGLPAASDKGVDLTMSKFFTKLQEEFKALLPPTIFFFVALHLVAFIRVLMLKGTGIAVSTPLQVTLAALILGKAVLVADLLPFINRYPDKPLIYNVAWKTTIYVLVAMLVHYLERLADFWREAGSLVAGNRKLLAEIVWPHFWAIQILLVVLILMYCTMHELVRVIGRDKVLEIFFGTPPRARSS